VESTQTFEGIDDDRLQNNLFVGNAGYAILEAMESTMSAELVTNGFSQSEAGAYLDKDGQEFKMASVLRGCRMRLEHRSDPGFEAGRVL